MAGDNIVADFVVLQHDEPIWIGDDNDKGYKPEKEWRFQFETKNLTIAAEERQAVLSFDVTQLTCSKADVPVKINGDVVGHIHRYYGKGTTAAQRKWSYWYSQSIVFSSALLKGDGLNEIVIGASPIDSEQCAPESDKDLLDDFAIKSVVCWYKRETKLSLFG